MEKEVLGKLLIAIIAVILIFAVVLSIVGNLKFKDSYCGFKSTLLTAAPDAGAKALVRGILECDFESQVVDGNDWSECPESMEKDFDKCRDKSCQNDILLDCSAYQMAKLSEKCWGRYLSGRFEPGVTPTPNFDCYEIRISDIPDAGLSQSKTGEYTTLVKNQQLRFVQGVMESDCKVESNRNYQMVYRDGNPDLVWVICD